MFFGIFESPIEKHEKQLAASPGDVKLMLKLAELYAQQRQPARVRELYERAGDLYSSDGFALKAIAAYRHALSIAPAAVELHSKIGATYRELGLVSDARREYEQLAKHLAAQGDATRLAEISALLSSLPPA